MPPARKPVRRTRRTAHRTLALLAVAASALTALTTQSGPALAAPPVPDSGTLTWTITPPGPDFRLDGGAAHEASAGRTEQTGITELEPRTLDSAVNTVRAELTTEAATGSGAVVDVRGLRSDGTWSEWAPSTPDSPATLPQASRTVQARLVLSAPAGAPGPRVHSVRLTGWRTAGASDVRPAAGEATYRVFATREGLVGGTTANGHVIVSRDQFVALPSRRGLSGKNAGAFSVQVCTENGARCAWAPVWDVGPWNTGDDYWNSPRANWNDLPQGLPEAQAAYQNGYNGGKDGFGRRVGNPAGIDLADGTFYDGVGLSDNSWVNVSYEWTGTGAWGTIDAAPLNVRSAPQSTAPQVGLAGRFAQVRIDCRVTGQTVTGSQGTSDQWYQLAPGKFVAKAYVIDGVVPAAC